jgi:putative acetyltransferase
MAGVLNLAISLRPSAARPSSNFREAVLVSGRVLDLSELQSPDISFWTILDNETLLGFGVLKRLSADDGKVKSMHTAQSMRRRGAGSAMLRHIIAAARPAGMSRLSLETGS